MLSCPKPANRANQKQNMIDCGPLSWPMSLLSWPTIGFLKKKTSLIVVISVQKKTMIILWLSTIDNNQ